MLPSVTQTFQVIATSIFNKMGTTPAESIKQYFKAQSLSESDILSELEFS
jgi:hypothetical protein